MCFGHRVTQAPPICARVLPISTPNGVFFGVYSLMDNGVFAPLFTDDFGQALRYVNAEMARRALWRAAVKWDAQGIKVLYEGD